ncbi:barren [Auricularia subglabra TFB-10046 SS5]|nr:barren [Auricularia subglabra TFB-10046 SS5]
MAPAAKKSRRKDDSDDEYGSDHTVTRDSPKAAPAGKKKRVASFLVPITNGEESFGEREARKDRRRSSFKHPLPPGDESQRTSDGHPQGHPPKTPHRRLSQLNAVPMTPALPASIEIMSSNYEEWMKMATDNKINAANSWNFALIDYFADMSLLRNDVDKSINFQKASCTLDGCVKIWTSRVDSVGTATGQLLSNLANDGKEEDEGGEGEDGEEGEGGTGEGVKKRKAHRPEATLAKSAAQLRAKKQDLDSDFTVDPLFKKTRADFDEGGAGGLLLNHLGVDGNIRVIFDSGDSNENQDDQDEEPVDLIDLSDLRRDFFPTLEGLDDLAISHSLEAFSFDKGLAGSYDATYLNETFRDESQSFGDDDDDGLGETTFRLDANGDVPMDTGADGGAPPVEDFFSGDQAVPDYDDFAPPMDDGSFDAENSGEAGATGESTAVQGSLEGFDPRRMPNEHEFTMAMADGEGSMMDYFDSGFLKNWAGPEHWKVRRKFIRPDTSAAEKSTEVKQKKEKKVFRVDFSAPAEKSAKELFAPVARGAGITLAALARPGSVPTKGKKKVVVPESRDNHLLPDDMHFSSKELITLFLKPKFSLKMRGQMSRPANGEEVDEQFWARAAADHAAGIRAQEEGDETGNGVIPFNTQFFHDDYDDGPGFDDVYDAGGGAAGSGDVEQEEDLLAATQGQTRRIRPEAINYSKRAKRVDVRKLKENIWKNLDIVVEHAPDADDSMQQEDNRPPTDPAEPRVFSSVIDGLKQSYPREKMDEISSSFCFICLLHLANEQGLKIAKEDLGVPQDAMDTDLDAPVGDIRALKVFRDPIATRSA